MKTSTRVSKLLIYLPGIFILLLPIYSFSLMWSSQSSLERSALQRVTRSNMNCVYRGLYHYHNMKNEYPNSIEELITFLETSHFPETTDGECDLLNCKSDGWDRSFLLTKFKCEHQFAIEIRSFGSNGVNGDSDDIVKWWPLKKSGCVLE